MELETVRHNREIAIKRMETIREIPKVFLDVVRNLVVISFILYAALLTHSPILSGIVILCGVALGVYCATYVVQITPRPGEAKYETSYRNISYIICGIVYVVLFFAMALVVNDVLQAQGHR